MPTYSTSTGERLTRHQIEEKIRAAKKAVLQSQLDEHGYNFCTTCKRNDDRPVDCAHIISVKECLESGRTELAWDTNNIIPEGRKCHQKRDGLDIRF